jgi:dienelactone hydrolase
MSRFPAALTLLAVLATVWSSQSAAARQQILVPTQDDSILVETFFGEAVTPRPAVIVLSGTKGFVAPVYDDIAQTFDKAGLDVFLVHFLSPADLVAIGAADGANARIRYYAERLPVWTAAVRAVISYLEAQPSHGGKIGVLGISLGAQVAAAAMANDTEIEILVLVDGGFPNDYADPIRSMPPLHLIWGGADQTFPLSIALDLKRRVEALGGPVDLDIYDGAGHDFFVRPGPPQSKAARRDAADLLAKALAE